MKRYKKLSLIFGAVVIFVALIPGITHMLLEAQAEALAIQKVQSKLDSVKNYRENIIRVEFKENLPLEKTEKLVGKRNIPPIFR